MTDSVEWKFIDAAKRGRAFEVSSLLRGLAFEVSSLLRDHPEIDVNLRDYYAETALHAASRRVVLKSSNCFWHTQT